MYFVNKQFSISSLVFLFINSLFTHSTSSTVDPAAVLSIHELLPQTPSERCSILNNFAMKPAVFEYSLNEAIRSCLPLFSLSFFPSSSSSSSFFSLFFLIHFFFVLIFLRFHLFLSPSLPSSSAIQKSPSCFSSSRKPVMTSCLQTYC